MYSILYTKINQCLIFPVYCISPSYLLYSPYDIPSMCSTYYTLFSKYNLYFIIPSLDCVLIKVPFHTHELTIYSTIMSSLSISQVNQFSIELSLAPLERDCHAGALQTLSDHIEDKTPYCFITQTSIQVLLATGFTDSFSNKYQLSLWGNLVNTHTVIYETI